MKKQEEKIDKLKIELAWAHVKVEEKELGRRMEDVEKGRRVMGKIEESLGVAKVCGHCFFCLSVRRSIRVLTLVLCR